MKNHIVEVWWLRDLPAEDYAACMRLGVQGGILRDELRACRGRRAAANVLIVREDLRVVGWALLSPGYDNRRNLMVYVRAASRRRGVGSALVRRALSIEPRPLVTTWDLPSRCFFDRLGFRATSFKLAQFKTAVDPVLYDALEPAL